VSRRRIFLAPLRPGVAHADAYGHWCGHHASVMRPLPELQGYVQHRPAADWWPHLGYLACGETWFADEEAERAAWSSDWYRDAIAPDERLMFATRDAWNARVVDVEELHEGPEGSFEAFGFGATGAGLSGAIVDMRVQRLRLSRPAPGSDEPVAIVAAAADPLAADHLARRLGGLAFAAVRAVIVPRPAVS
jgi:EthD domain